MTVLRLPFRGVMRAARTVGGHAGMRHEDHGGGGHSMAADDDESSVRRRSSLFKDKVALMEAVAEDDEFRERKLEMWRRVKGAMNRWAQVIFNYRHHGNPTPP